MRPNDHHPTRQTRRCSHRTRSEDEWFECRLLNDPRFLKRVEAARQSFRAGRGVPLEEVPE